MASYTYKGTGITGRTTTPSVYQSSGVTNALVGQTYYNTDFGHVYECVTAGGPSVAKWSYVYTAYKFKGTGVTGTASQAKVFVRSGVANAKARNTYLNTNTGHVYQCVTPGGPKVATWVYYFTATIGVPKVGVSSLCAPVRRANGSHTLDAAWKVPASLTKATNGFRASSLTVTWALSTKGGNLGGSKSRAIKTGTGTTSSSVNLSSFNGGDVTYTRASFYPLTSVKLLGASITVRPDNARGKGSKPVSTSIQFGIPRKPSISAVSFDSSTGTLSATITTNSGYDRYERYDTEYTWQVYNSRTKTYLRNVRTAVTNVNIPLSVDVSDYQQLSETQYVKFYVKARSRGYAGASAWVERTYYLAFPKRATISGVDANDSSGRATVRIKTNNDDVHTVRKVQLWTLANVEYARASDIPADAPWSDTDAVDDGQCTALSIGVGDLMPSAGYYTWVRIRSWAIDETVLHVDSAPYNVRKLHSAAPTAADDPVYILSLASGADGQSAVVRLGWAPGSAVDDSTATELTWSDDVNAWISTDEPDSYTFARNDGAATVGGVRYKGTATVHIKGLDEGVAYHIRARRVREGDTTTYGDWSDDGLVIPSVAPSEVVATVPAAIASGAGLPVSWTYAGGGTQKAWKVMHGTKVMASGSGTQGSYVLSASTVAKFAENGAVTLAVSVSTGGGSATSEVVTVAISQAPTVALDVPATLTAQPLSLGVTASEACTLSVVVTSEGNEGQTPAGVTAQPLGDTIWSAALVPTWAEENDELATTVTLPERLPFADNGAYTVAVTPTSVATGMVGETVAASTSVAWSAQAPTPDEGAVTLTPRDYVDDDGRHHQSVHIALAPNDSEESGSTDVYDIYRMTGDGAVAIGTGWPLTSEATDEYAPFGDGMALSYRVARRTEDGDVAWSDYEYDLPGDAIRIDWDGQSVELPYDIAISDAYAKDVDVHRYLDGSTDALYELGVTRTAKLSTDVIRLDDQRTVALVRSLARYAGPAFVRTPDGSAYEADVQVTDMSTEGMVQAVAIDATEVRLTPAYELPTYNAEVEP